MNYQTCYISRFYLTNKTIRTPYLLPFYHRCYSHFNRHQVHTCSILGEQGLSAYAGYVSGKSEYILSLLTLNILG